ncbi:Fic family protein [Estrella lausannensis]|uniref:Fido domain-containing protein n=1 Tax=Estrella lausannensis TaxID=483423 RepID=A0A0H5DP36_9BACT|nr:Fic family protein [Estrella lausannensis]CRX37663.1 hypothetical protein ELAC_0302 [Estrella lausannensis]
MNCHLNPDSRTIAFLNESNKIEGIHDIDYSVVAFQDPQKGHFGAYVISQEAALAEQPLNIKMIRQWQAMIGQEQKEFTGDAITDEEIGHIRGPNLQKNVRIGKHIPPEWRFVPLYMQNWLEDVNEDLSNNSEIYKSDDGAFAEFVGKYFLRFERIHPFGDGNGRTGRIIANYLTTRCARPLLVFPSDYRLKNRYYEAHESESAMASYISSRVAEIRAHAEGR